MARARRQTSRAMSVLSNMRLASGVIRMPEIKARNMTFGLGLDGGTNDTSDMFSDMRAAVGPKRATAADPTVLLAARGRCACRNPVHLRASYPSGRPRTLTAGVPASREGAFHDRASAEGVLVSTITRPRSTGPVAVCGHVGAR